MSSDDGSRADPAGASPAAPSGPAGGVRLPLSGGRFGRLSSAIVRPLGSSLREPAPDDRTDRRAHTPPRISVVIPTLNEESNIAWVLDRIDGSVDEVVLVDGRSDDATVDIARRTRADVRVLEQPVPGKGAALALGLCAASGDIIVMMDGDGSMDPVEVPGFVGALLSGADVAKGSRNAAGGGSRDMSVVRRFGNRALTGLTNRTYRLRWSELCYGYAALWADVVPVLELSAVAAPAVGEKVGPTTSAPAYGHGFEIEALIYCRAARAALRVSEVPSFEHPRRSGTSHLRPWRDGWRVLTALAREATWSSDQPAPRRADRRTGRRPHPPPSVP